MSKGSSRGGTKSSSGGGGPGIQKPGVSRSHSTGEVANKEASKQSILAKNEQLNPEPDTKETSWLEKHGIEVRGRSLEGFTFEMYAEQRRRDWAVLTLLGLLVANFFLEARDALPLVATCMNDVLIIWKLSKFV